MNEIPTTPQRTLEQARHLAKKHQKVTRIYWVEKLQTHWIRFDHVERTQIYDDGEMIDLHQVWAIIPEKAFDSLPYADTWTTERRDWQHWEDVRPHYMGKRTMLTPGPALIVEGLHFEVVESEEEIKPGCRCHLVEKDDDPCQD